MPDDAERKAAAKAVKAVQKEFLRQTSDAHAARRKVFEEAQKAGLTLREIGELAGVHHTTVGEIVRGR
jgi:DNA-directed RNA polymerase specialized sigma24 family protein